METVSTLGNALATHCIDSRTTAHSWSTGSPTIAVKGASSTMKKGKSPLANVLRQSRIIPESTCL